MKTAFALLLYLSISLIYSLEQQKLPSISFDIEGKTDFHLGRKHILYLLKTGKIAEAIDAYQNFYSLSKVHDFETLEEIAHILLDQGAKSSDDEERLLCIYALGICGISSFPHLLEAGIASSNPLVQMSTIQLLGQIQEDFVTEIIASAMHSPFLMIRMEAASILAIKKHRSAVGQIESLMYKLPKPFWVFFPELFAEVGSLEAIHLLGKLMSDEDLPVRIAAINSAARFGRDDLLSMIRAYLTHLDLAEQEAAAAAVGYLKDLKSADRLKKLADAQDPSVRLTAARSLYQLGFSSYLETIENLAQKENLFAIHILEQIPESKDILAKLLHSENRLVRLNAAYALLKNKDKRCFPYLYEILIKNASDLTFIPHFSLGHSLHYFKIYGSSTELSKYTKSDLNAISLNFREKVLLDCIELPENIFLEIARTLFEKRQIALIPLLVHLLENLQSEEAIKLLKEQSQHVGAPLIRTYCHLALYRLGIESENFLQFISREKGKKALTFRPMLPWEVRNKKSSEFLLTPEETSRLLIESFFALALHHDPKNIDVLLNALKEGHFKNRSLLAGILLKAIQ